MFHIFSETFLKRKIKIKNYQVLLKQSIKLLTVRDENYILKGAFDLRAAANLLNAQLCGLNEMISYAAYRVHRCNPLK